MSKPGAIKISLGAKKPATKPSQESKPIPKASNGIKRTPGSKFSFGGGEDDEHEDEEGRSVEVTHFDQTKGGAHHEEGTPTPQSAKERVIECAPNRNWRDEAVKKRQKSALPGRNQGAQVEEEEDGKQEMVFGLNVNSSKPTGYEESLTGSTANASRGAVFEEQRAYEDDLERAPEAPSLSDYDKVPVEGFGLAMLRGMGYKEKDKDEKKDNKKGTVEVRRRPALLGIGAKPLEEDKKR